MVSLAVRALAQSGFLISYQRSASSSPNTSHHTCYTEQAQEEQAKASTSTTTASSSATRWGARAAYRHAGDVRAPYRATAIGHGAALSGGLTRNGDIVGGTAGQGGGEGKGTVRNHRYGITAVVGQDHGPGQTGYRSAHGVGIRGIRVAGHQDAGDVGVGDRPRTVGHGAGLS